MFDKSQQIQKKISNEIDEFRDDCHCLLLATKDEEGIPHVSYSPFVFHEQHYYILISDVAQHGQNIKLNPELSIMMIQDEKSSRTLYARQRLTYQARATYIERDTPLWTELTGHFSQRFGDIITDLCQMRDFRLYQLAPHSGRYVKGFGQAFEVTGDGQVEVVHLKQGHQKI